MHNFIMRLHWTQESQQYVKIQIVPLGVVGAGNVCASELLIEALLGGFGVVSSMSSASF